MLNSDGWILLNSLTMNKDNAFVIIKIINVIPRKVNNIVTATESVFLSILIKF